MREAGRRVVRGIAGMAKPLRVERERAWRHVMPRGDERHRYEAGRSHLLHVARRVEKGVANG